ncbi:MAG TPA: glutathione S-transferase N-terminal domain-containing protein [Burkholderiales bacterium]|jgi:glutathione S-transferase
MTIALYHSPGACSMAPHVALSEIGVDYEPRRVNFAEKQQNSPEYLKINPKGRVPVLLIDGFVITEVPAILTYLAQRFPQANLLPAGGEAMGRCLEWLGYGSSTVHPAYAHLRRPERYTPEAPAFPAMQERGESSFMDSIAFIDSKLAGKQFAAGDAYSIADAYLLVFFGWANGLKKHNMAEKFPNYSAVARRVLARPAVQRVIELEKMQERYTF